MNASISNSGASSVTTSSSAPPSGKIADPRQQSEAEYLRAQAEAAKSAIVATISQMKAEVADGLDPLELARRHPWVTLVGSALGGFAAGATLTRSKEQQALDHLRKVHETINGTAAPQPENGKTAPAHGSKPIGHLVVERLLEMLGPILIQLVSTALSRPSAANATTTKSSQSSTSPPPSDSTGGVAQE